MATGGLYGNASESVGLYGNTTNFGGSYFEWFIFYQSDTQPATPTGGSWSFTTNSGTPPTGWSVVPFPAPTLPVWVSIALVNSRSDVPLVWSAPGLFSYSSGLPILSGSGTPAVGDGINSQLYVQTSTTPQTIWFKQSGTWNRLVGSTLYADLTSAQTVAGIKTFSSPIVGSVTGTSANVTGIVDIANGGTSSTTANGAFNALAPSQTSQAGKYLTTDGTNASWGTNPLGTVTSVDVSGGTTGLTTSGGPVTTSGTITLAGTLAVANGGTGATTTGVALTNLGAVGTIASADASIVVTRVGSSVDLSVSTTSPASVLLEQVRNTTGATLTKGTAVYISGATGQIPTVSKALATSDATSAQTLGLITSNLANNSNGYVTIIGLISDLDTSAYTDGQQLYLSPITAGTLTATKPYAPQHLVYMAVVAHAHPTQGKLLVKVQNGYELDEIHNVAAQSPTTGQTIVWNSATSLWEKNTVSLTVGVNGTLPILNGGTGQATANAAFNALAPSQSGQSGKYLTTDGTNTSWGTNPLGTVTSVAATVPSFLSIAGSPITTSGTLAISLSGTALPTTSGGTGLTSFTSGGVVYASSSSALATGSALTFDGTVFKNDSASVADISVRSALGNAAFMRIAGNANTLGTTSFDFVQGSDSSAFIFNRANAPIVFGVNNTEVMRLTSTSLYTASGINVAFGTPSPVEKLTVNGAIAVTGGITGHGANRTTLSQEGANGAFWQSYGANASTYGRFVMRQASSDFSLARSVVVIETTGYVGLGVTPYTNLTVGDTSDVGIAMSNSSSVTSGNRGSLSISNSAGSTVGLIRFGAVTDNVGTEIQFYTRPAAGSLTQTMTHTASGNLALGKTSASYRFDLQGAAGENQTLAGFFSGTNTARGLTLGLSSGGTAVNDAFAVYNATLGGGYSGHIWQAGGAEQARINQNGYFGIGTNLPVGKLQVSSDNPEVYITDNSISAPDSAALYLGIGTVTKYAGLISDFSNDQLLIRHNQQTRATFDANGNYLIGGSSNALGARLLSENASGNQLALRYTSVATWYTSVDSSGNYIWTKDGGTIGRFDSSGNFLVNTTSATTLTTNCIVARATQGALYVAHENGNTGSNFGVFVYDGTTIGSISQVSTTGVLYNTTSDQRLKDNIQDADSASSLIDSLQVRKFDWKSDGSHTRYGFVAQELVTVAPEAVHQPVDTNEMMAVDYSKLVPILVKEIQSLRQRLSAANL